MNYGDNIQRRPPRPHEPPQESNGDAWLVYAGELFSYILSKQGLNTFIPNAVANQRSARLSEITARVRNTLPILSLEPLHSEVGYAIKQLQVSLIRLVANQVNRAEAIAMALHPRLGQRSPMAVLGPEIMHIINAGARDDAH